MQEEIKGQARVIKSDKVPDGWKKVKIADICELSSGSTPSRKNKENFNGEILWVTSGELKSKYLSMTNEMISKQAVIDSGLRLYEPGTVVIAIYGLEADGIRGTCSITTKECTISQACMAFTDFKEIDKEYFYYWYQNNGNRIGLKYAQGTKQQNLCSDLIGKIDIAFPPICEQRQILKYLGTLDEIIEKMQTLIHSKQKQKYWLMQNLLTGKKRLSGFQGEWKKIKLRKFVSEINERSTFNNEYDILSVTKTGICLQSEHFNKQIASEDNTGYKVIRKGNLVFSTMNLWMGSLDVLEKYDVGIVSPAYKVFRFNEEYMLAWFGKYFMKSDHMIWIYNINSEQGASIVRRNLDLDGLLNYMVEIPDIDEQKAIAKVLETADKEINLLEQKLELVKQEKKAIMQLLLTGIVRVNEK